MADYIMLTDIMEIETKYVYFYPTWIVKSQYHVKKSRKTC